MWTQKLVNAKLDTRNRGLKHGWLVECHQGGEGQQWTVVPYIKKKKEEE